MARKKPQTDQAEKPAAWERPNVIVIGVAIALLCTIVSTWLAGATWTQNMILFATAVVVYLYTRETARLREATRAMVAEAKQSREQADVAGAVDAEIRLYNATHDGMSASMLADLGANWAKAVCHGLRDDDNAGKNDYNPPLCTQALLVRREGTDNTSPLNINTSAFSIDAVVNAINGKPPQSLAKGERVRSLGDNTRAAVKGHNVEKALRECELLIHLANGRCEDASRIAKRRLKAFDGVMEVLVSHIAFHKWLTGKANYGDAYLVYFEKTTNGKLKEQIHKVYSAGKDNEANN